MSRRLIIRAEAEMDIGQAALWYAGQAQGVEESFLSEVHAAIQRALENPLAYRRLRRRPEVRRVLTARFPYRIFYVLRPDAVVIIRVLHGARHPGEWTKNV